MHKDGRLSQRHPKWLLNRAAELAEERGTTLTEVVQAFLRSYVREANEPQPEENLGIEQA